METAGVKPVVTVKFIIYVCNCDPVKKLCTLFCMLISKMS